MCTRSVRGSCETYTDPVAVPEQWTSARRRRRRHVNPRVSGPYARQPIRTQTKPTDFKTVVSPPMPPLPRVDQSKSGRRRSSSCKYAYIILHRVYTFYLPSSGVKIGWAKLANATCITAKVGGLKNLSNIRL